MKLYIDLFYSLAQDAKQEGQYERAQGFETAGNAVNNLGHGKPAREYLPTVREILLKNCELDWASDELKSAWTDAADLIENELENLTKV